MRRAARLAGTLLLAAGVLTLVWAVVVWRWQDPFTALYTHFEQSRLASSYAKRARAYRPPPAATPPAAGTESVAARERQLAVDARAYARTLHTGDPVGKITIGRIGLHMVVVQGTDHDTLTKGPGHYLQSGLPGEGRLIYIAGHRTTYLAPFAHIDDIRIGDYVELEVPYGTFTYRVTRHWIVPSTDLAVLEDHGAEVLRLQACHPRFFATHRYLVDARLVSVTPRGGAAFAVPASTPAGT
ncbi:MAG TPA: class D sortase [Gaiellaceae bacterium]|nr:class D sortase [Gaiellaceae bacterium]